MFSTKPGINLSGESLNPMGC